MAKATANATAAKAKVFRPLPKEFAANSRAIHMSNESALLTLDGLPVYLPIMLRRRLFTANPMEGVPLGSAWLPHNFQFKRIRINQFVNDRSYMRGIRRA
jgi:hypothetical protein